MIISSSWQKIGHHDEYFVILTNFSSRWPKFCHHDKYLIILTKNWSSWKRLCHCDKYFLIMTKSWSWWQKIGHGDQNFITVNKSLSLWQIFHHFDQKLVITMKILSLWSCLDKLIFVWWWGVSFENFDEGVPKFCLMGVWPPGSHHLAHLWSFISNIFGSWLKNLSSWPKIGHQNENYVIVTKISWSRQKFYHHENIDHCDKNFVMMTKIGHHNKNFCHHDENFLSWWQNFCCDAGIFVVMTKFSSRWKFLGENHNDKIFVTMT